MAEASSLSRVLRHPTASTESLESVALMTGAGFFVIGWAVSWAVFWGRDLEIAGTGSIGEYIGIASAIAAVIVFVFGRVLVVRRGHPATRQKTPAPHQPGARLHWFDVAALAVAHGVIALLAWIGLADLLEDSFIDAVVYPFAGAILAGVAVSLTSYVVFLSSVHLTPMTLSLVLAVFLVVGALASMLSASDPHWWRENLSALGMTSEVSALTFNVTLIVAGVIITIIARYATVALPAGTRREIRGRALLRTGLMLIGIFLALVGVFPVDEFFLLHTAVATGMGVVFGAIVIAMPWLIPSMPRAFVLLGYLYVALIAAAAILYAVGYYDLTAVELVSALLIFSWIIVFLRNAGAMRSTAESDATPAVNGEPEVARADPAPA